MLPAAPPSSLCTSKAPVSVLVLYVAEFRPPSLVATLLDRTSGRQFSGPGKDRIPKRMLGALLDGVNGIPPFYDGDTSLPFPSLLYYGP